MFHLHVSRISRGKGRSAVAAACYVENAKGMRDERLGKTFYYQTWGKSVLCLGSSLPNGAGIDTADLWNRAERAENRKDALTARQVEFAFPFELTAPRQIKAARELEKWIHERYGAATTLALHMNEGNPHAHLMFTTRAVSADGTFAKYKLAVLNDRKTGPQEIETMRAKWAEICNARLSKKNKIDHRSYERQGVDRIPQIHLGQAVTAQIRKAKAKGEPVPEYLFKPKINDERIMLQEAKEYELKLQIIEEIEAELQQKEEQKENGGENQTRNALRGEGKDDIPGASGQPAPVAERFLHGMEKDFPEAGTNQFPNDGRAAGEHGEVPQQPSGRPRQRDGFQETSQENGPSGNRGTADSIRRSGRRFTKTDLIGRGGVNLLRAGIAFKTACAELEEALDLEALHSARKTESQRLSQLRPGT